MIIQNILYESEDLFEKFIYYSLKLINRRLSHAFASAFSNPAEFLDREPLHEISLAASMVPDSYICIAEYNQNNILIRLKYRIEEMTFNKMEYKHPSYRVPSLPDCTIKTIDLIFESENLIKNRRSVHNDNIKLLVKYLDNLGIYDDFLLCMEGRMVVLL